MTLALPAKYAAPLPDTMMSHRGAERSFSVGIVSENSAYQSIFVNEILFSYKPFTM